MYTIIVHCASIQTILYYYYIDLLLLLLPDNLAFYLAQMKASSNLPMPAIFNVKCMESINHSFVAMLNYGPPAYQESKSANASAKG